MTEFKDIDARTVKRHFQIQQIQYGNIQKVQSKNGLSSLNY